MLDVLCVGDSTIDIFLRLPEDNPNFTLEKDANKLLIGLGEKIHIDKYVVNIGGNATNTAVGLSRLGLKTGLLAEIGSDEFSNKIINDLTKEKINTDLVLQNENQKTSISVIVSFDGERTIFNESVKRFHNFNFQNVSTKLIYLTSLGNVWENAYQRALDFIKENRPILAFNPGTLQLEKRDKLVMDIIEKTDYLFVNKEEAEILLYGKEFGLKLENQEGLTNLIKKLLFGLKSLGAKNVIITNSDNGSYCQDINNNIYHLGIVKVNVVEKTGAGDAYTAGFLAAILNKESINTAMVWGAVEASSIIQHIGAGEGILTRNELIEKIKSLNSFIPQKI